MRRFAPLLFAALPLLLAGCRQDPYMEAYIDTLNLEKLALEDRIYELEYDYEKLLEKLKKSESGKSSSSPAGSPGPSPTPADQSSANDSRSNGSRNSQSQDTSSGGPQIEFGDDTQDGPSVEFNDPPPSPLDFSPTPGGEEDAPKPPFDLESFKPLPTPAANRSQYSKSRRNLRTQKLSSIQIDHRYTGAEDTGSDQAPRGLRVVIQPRDADRRFLPATGDLAIVAFDADTKQRVARWDFEADEVQELLSKSSPRGIDFRTNWPAKAAQAKRLHLFARLTTNDGRELKSDREISLASNRPPSQQWTARTQGGQLTVPTTQTRQVSGEQPINASSARIPSGVAPIREHLLDQNQQNAIEVEEDVQRRRSSPDLPAAAPLPRRKLVKPEWKPYR